VDRHTDYGNDEHKELGMSNATIPSYGTSDHYLGEKGEEYFAWQGGGGMFAGRINAHKFKHLIRPEHTVLDFGCGGGFLLKNLDCAGRVGVEINPAARRNAIGLGCECYASVAEVPDAVADVIVTDHALEHVPYPIGALSELRTKLKPDGILALYVPIDNWRHQRAYDPNDLNHHLHTWTPQLMGNTLGEAGFEVVSVWARVSAWPGKWTVATYGRLPFWMFRSICRIYGALTGKGQEVGAIARPKRPGSAR
jgi:SAM-dependent methyltransferase